MTSKDVRGWRSGTSSSWFPSRKRLLNPGPRPVREVWDIWRVTAIPSEIKNRRKGLKTYEKEPRSNNKLNGHPPSPAPCYPDTAPSVTSPEDEKCLDPPSGLNSQTASGLGGSPSCSELRWAPPSACFLPGGEYQGRWPGPKPWARCDQLHSQWGRELWDSLHQSRCLPPAWWQRCSPSEVRAGWAPVWRLLWGNWWSGFSPGEDKSVGGDLLI